MVNRHAVAVRHALLHLRNVAVVHGEIIARLTSPDSGCKHCVGFVRRQWTKSSGIARWIIKHGRQRGDFHQCGALGCWCHQRSHRGPWRYPFGRCATDYWRKDLTRFAKRAMDNLAHLASQMSLALGDRARFLGKPAKSGRTSISHALTFAWWPGGTPNAGKLPRTERLSWETAEAVGGCAVVACCGRSARVESLRAMTSSRTPRLPAEQRFAEISQLVHY